jgi:hypothetical protein
LPVRARVFISCSQAKGTDEITIASEVELRLRQLGFVPYVAVSQQSLRGLTDNIFQQLRNSEYFIFIDFKREQLVTSSDFRGSLFSHQELAIASFLDLQVLAFQEKGIKWDDGIIRFLQANAIQFSDRNNLTNDVIGAVQTGGWDPTWRNELVLERVSTEFSDANIMNQGGRRGRFFHVAVRNHHPDKFATDCYVYLEKVVRTRPTPEIIPIKTVEFKWAGTLLPNVGIAPKSFREFDAFYILYDAPTVVLFNALTDASDYHPNVRGEGEYELSYLVASGNFPALRHTFKLSLGRQLLDTAFSM